MSDDRPPVRVDRFLKAGPPGPPLPPGMRVDKDLDAIVCVRCGLVVVDMAAATKIADPMELRRFVGDAIGKHTCGTPGQASVDVDLARLQDKIERRREEDPNVPPHVLHRFDPDTGGDGDDTTCLVCGGGSEARVHRELADVVDMHRDDSISEGQTSKLLDIDRVDVRLLRDLMPPYRKPGPSTADP